MVCKSPIQASTTSGPILRTQPNARSDYRVGKIALTGMPAYSAAHSAFATNWTCPCASIMPGRMFLVPRHGMSNRVLFRPSAC
jgi:hypothetical protein